MMAGCRVRCWLVLVDGWLRRGIERRSEGGRGECVRVEGGDRKSECRRGSDEARKEKDTKVG